MKHFLGRWVVGGLLGLCLWFNVFASDAELQNLSVRLPVTSYASDALQENAARALQQLIVQLTGNEAAASAPAVQTVLPKVTRYIVSYQYQQDHSLPAGERWFVVQFDQNVVHNLVKSVQVAHSKETSLVGGSATVTASVSGVQNMSEFQQVMQVLAALPGASRVQLVAMKTDHVILTLDMLGGKEALRNALRTNMQGLIAQDGDGKEDVLDLEWSARVNADDAGAMSEKGLNE